MTYDFESIIDRRHSTSVKWDVKDGELPMWVADMDFKTAPEIIAAMQAKVDLGVFGYEEPRADYFEAIIAWYQKYHQVNLKAEWMLFATGVVPALSSAVRRLTSIGDNVLVQAPVYNIFYNSIVNSGRHVVSSDLVFDQEKLLYHVDWTDLEAKLADPLTNMMILCNPHNPLGRIWTKDELEKLAQLCQKYQVKLVSDEIHGEITYPGFTYNSLLSLDPKFLTTAEVLISPSKAFNVAALHAATVIVPDANLRAQVSRGLNSEELAEPNLLALPASIAAYTKGHPWLEALQQQLAKNKADVAAYLAKKIPEVKLLDSQATYLLWIYTGYLTHDSKKLAAFIRQETGLYLSNGTVYGGNGQDFLRMNIACPNALIQDGLKRLERGIKQFKQDAQA